MSASTTGRVDGEVDRTSVSNDPLEAKTSKNRLYREAQILNFLGWLSGELPELHQVEVPKLREAWEKWRDVWWPPTAPEPRDG